VLADVAVALIVVGWLLPATTAFIMVATLPMAAIAARNRLRAVIAGGVAGTTVGMLIAGTGLAGNVAAVAVLGALLGVGWRRRWGVVRLVMVAVGLFWPPAAAAVDGMLIVFRQLRMLALEQITNTWQGAKANLADIGLRGVGAPVDPMVNWIVKHWAIGVPGALLAAIVAGTLVGRLLVWQPLARLAESAAPLPPPRGADDPPGRAEGRPRRAHARSQAAEPPAKAARARRAGTADRATAATAGPVPVELQDVGYTYPGATTPALQGISLTVQPGEFVAVVGANGSGKSTLVRILGGRAPTTGLVRRPGSAAPGRPGGTAMVFQRPESQVLGVRVRDDVVWGLARNHGVDVEGLLQRVGLGGFGDRETATLSGGELQRLAVASALARRPRLLLSDEATAMVDAEGRDLLTHLLAALAADEGIAVVHVTHRRAEAALAGRTLYLDRGRLVEAPPPPPAPLAAQRPPAPGGPLLELSGVGHVYSAGTPWAHRALAAIDLQIREGEALMVLGRNGSGKSTLAWILAGLTVPSEGDARLRGAPIDTQVGRVALSFQHARLQLLRRSVQGDVRAASGVDPAGADRALELVGLDPGELRGRSVDELSGGQQRRVALAGMLARSPQVLVLDEPFAGLDDAARRGLISVLARLRAETGLTLAVVTHDTEGAADVVDRIVTLDRGRIVADHPVAELTSP
jgi:energy-coupling factor transport system ATP-binding protein